MSYDDERAPLYGPGKFVHGGSPIELLPDQVVDLFIKSDPKRWSYDGEIDPVWEEMGMEPIPPTYCYYYHDNLLVKLQPTDKLAWELCYGGQVVADVILVNGFENKHEAIIDPHALEIIYLKDLNPLVEE